MISFFIILLHIPVSGLNILSCEKPPCKGYCEDGAPQDESRRKSDISAVSATSSRGPRKSAALVKDWVFQRGLVEDGGGDNGRILVYSKFPDISWICELRRS